MHIIASPELEGLFREIVTAGWANQSDGNVEAPTGYFAKVTIAANELSELIESVFESTGPLAAEVSQIKPGNYLMVENGIGQANIFWFENEHDLDRKYNELVAEFSHWLDQPVFSGLPQPQRPAGRWPVRSVRQQRKADLMTKYAEGTHRDDMPPADALAECYDLWVSGAWPDSNALANLEEVMEHVKRLLDASTLSAEAAWYHSDEGELT